MSNIPPVLYEEAATDREYFERQAVFVPPPDATYDNRPDLSSPEVIFIRREPWQAKAMCRNVPGIMYDRQEGEPAHTYEERVIIAKKFCGSCVVRDECLDYALTNRENYHIWGGLTAQERKKLLKTLKVS